MKLMWYLMKEKDGLKSREKLDYEKASQLWELLD
jgi:hypothetical protein